jgi:polyhydroxyalkanoate synthesis regulator phasin
MAQAKKSTAKKSTAKKRASKPASKAKATATKAKSTARKAAAKPAATASRAKARKPAAKKPAARKPAARKPASSRPGARSAAPGRSDKSVQAYRDALERSVTLSRDWLQETVDDAVERGRMTRTDANELVSRLVSRGREQTEELLSDLEGLLEQARKGVDARVTPARKRVERAAGKAGKAARDAADGPLARADQLRRRAPVSAGPPITAYEALTVPQIKSRLKDLRAPELRKVRTQEKRGKGRKSVLDAIEKQLG